MADPISIKSKIIAAILALLDPLKADETFRVIEQSMDLMVNADKQPALQLYDGPERLVGKDNRGRTYHFDIGLKILLSDARSVADQKNIVVPKVQKIIESNLQLGGLADFIDGGEEVPFLAEATKPLGGALILYTIQYRRVLGDPYTTY